MRLLLALVLLTACGGDDPEVASTTGGAQRSSGSENEAEPDDGLAIEGLMGSLSTDAVERGLRPKQAAFQRCFTQRYDTIDMVAGRIELSFRVRVDGTVLWVYPSGSTIGDRVVEACIVGAAQSARFERPQGGEAEFSWGFEIGTLDDVRPPLDWAPDQIAETLEANTGVAQQCNVPSNSVHVTAYVAPGGQPLAVGASSQDRDAASSLDCVADAIRAWQFTDPGSYAAKVTFLLP